MGSDLSDLGLLVIQIDGIHMDEDMTLVAAIGVDVNGDKHPLGLVEGATENAATVQALIDNLVERGLDPAVPRLFIIDGSKALSKAIRATFGRDAAIQRCRIHKARNIMDRLPKSMHAQVRRVLRQAWEMDDADKAEKLLRNLARRLERDWEGVAASILEGLDEMLTVTKLGLPPELRRSLACTNIIENVMGTVRRVSRNVKYWRSPSMALRWAGAAMQEAAKGFSASRLTSSFHFSRQRSPFARQEPLHRTRILPKPRRLRRFSISDAASRFSTSSGNVFAECR